MITVRRFVGQLKPGTRPPADDVPNSNDLRVTEYEVAAAATEIDTEAEILATELEPSDGTFIKFGNTWQYLPGWSDPASDWNTVDFDDSNWFSGATKIGYGDGKFATDLSSTTQKEGTPILVQRVDKQSGMVVAVLSSGEDVDSVFMRHTFTITDTVPLTHLEMEVAYEGGFIAYLNGVEVARRGLDPSSNQIFFDTLASDREAGIAREVFDLSPYIPNLNTTANVLAFQVHRSEGSSILSINPRLTWESDPTQISIADSNDSTSIPSVQSPSPLTVTDISNG